MNSEIRLLIVEDNPSDAELAEYTLRSAGIEFVSRIVETEDEYIDALNVFSPDIILSDYDLPLFTGALAQKIAREKCPQVPFILFTGAMGEERAIEILTGGATDYVMKNRLSRLVPAVARALKESEEHRKRKEAEAERDALFQELEMKVQERTAQLQAEIAERKRAEEELRQSEAKYRKLFEDTDQEKNYIKAILQALPVGLAIVDTKGATVMSNAAFESAWGNPRPVAKDLSEYTAYKAWWSNGTLVKPKEWASSVAVAKGKAVLGQQMEIQRFDGSHAFVLNSAVPVHNSSGDITGAAVALMDITEQKMSQQEALSAAAFLKSTLDAAPAIIWTAHDSECRRISGNRAAYAFLRVREGINLSKTGPGRDLLSYRIFHNGLELQPDELPLQSVARTGQEKRNYSLDYHFDDGSIRSVLGDVVPVLDINGHPAGAIAAFVDITQLRQAERLLLWNKDRDELLADVASRLLTSESPQNIANELFQKTMKFLECDVFFNYLVNENMGCLHLNAYSGIPEDEAKKIEYLDYGVAVCGCAARDAKRLIMDDIPETPDVRTELVKSYGVKAYACHPFIIEGKVLGTVSFGTRSRTHFQAKELDVMKTVADFVAIAMHRLVSNQALKESEARYKYLFEKGSKSR